MMSFGFIMLLALVIFKKNVVLRSSIKSQVLFLGLIRYLKLLLFFISFACMKCEGNIAETLLKD